MVDEFDEIGNGGKRRWLAALAVNLALIAMVAFAAYMVLQRSAFVTISSIVASRTIRISAEHRGKIKALYVGETQEFKVGDPLFDLEDPLLDSRIAEVQKTIKGYEVQLAEQESALARRLREFDPKMKIETAQQTIKEKQVALKNQEMLLDSGNRRLAVKEEALQKAEQLFTSGAITRSRLDSYRLDAETERVARDKVLAEQNVLRTEISGLETQIRSYQTMMADLTRSTADQERTLRDKLAAVAGDLANLESERTQLFCKAKVSGSIAMLLKNEGEVVAPGDAVLEATSGDEIWVEAYFRPEDANLLRVNNQLTVRYGAQAFPVSVESVGLITKPFPFQRSMLVQPENFVVVKLDFAQPDPARAAGLRPGMQVTTELARREGLLYRLGFKNSADDPLSMPKREKRER